MLITSTRQLSACIAPSMHARASSAVSACTQSASSLQRSSACCTASAGASERAGSKRAVAQTSKAPRTVLHREATAVATSAEGSATHCSKSGPTSPPASAISGCIRLAARLLAASKVRCCSSTPSVSAAECSSASRNDPLTPRKRKRKRGQLADVAWPGRSAI